ncbi:MAG: tetraacyldisaccharide 4'-kinase [Deltaproteobacteria bacterium]|nr:tetraacyldisaccharide 4'-kinase [Deltaproteobacteria bacterium]
MGVSLRNAGYDKGFFKQTRLPCKVISIGNIAAGGTGKTPMTILVAKLLKEAGFRPVILSRGYGGKTPAAVNIVSDGKDILLGPEEGGDEPVMMARACPGMPVISGRQRRVTGAYAVDHFLADVLILDDGFQHRSLYRDMDIVLVDKDRPLGNGFMLPRGPLREPAKALRRADLIVKTEIKTNPFADEPDISFPDASIVFHGYRQPTGWTAGMSGQSCPPDYLKDKRLCAFAGIAVPDAFKKTLESLGLNVVVWIPFPDHHRYTEKDIAEICRRSRDGAADMIVATEKDGVKLSQHQAFLEKILLLKIEMVIRPSSDKLTSMIIDKLGAGRI